MARAIGRLTALKVDKAKRAGMYPDGGGLYLRVTHSGTKNWVFRFMLNGRPRWMGVGPLHTIGLAEARNRAAAFRLQRHDGIDPIERRRAERLEARLDASAEGHLLPLCYHFFLEAPVYSLSRREVNAGGSISLHSWQNVTIEVEGYSHRRMPEPFTGNLRMHVTGEQVCGMAVSKIVESNTW